MIHVNTLIHTAHVADEVTMIVAALEERLKLQTLSNLISFFS